MPAALTQKGAAEAVAIQPPLEPPAAQDVTDAEGGAPHLFVAVTQHAKPIDPCVMSPTVDAALISLLSLRFIPPSSSTTPPPSPLPTVSLSVFPRRSTLSSPPFFLVVCSLFFFDEPSSAKQAGPAPPH